MNKFRDSSHSGKGSVVGFIEIEIRDYEKKSVNMVFNFRTSMIMTGERLENKLFALVLCISAVSAHVKNRRESRLS